LKSCTKSEALESHLKVLNSNFPNGCTNHVMNYVKTFDYFCHNTMFTVSYYIKSITNVGDIWTEKPSITC